MSKWDERKSFEKKLEGKIFELQFFCNVEGNTPEDREYKDKLADEVLQMQSNYKTKYGHFYEVNKR